MPAESVKRLVEQGKPRTRGDDRALSELARRQHGVVSRRQLLEQGWTREEIDWRLRHGRLHRLHAGVYGVGHRLVPREGWLMAAVLASGPEAVLSHRSAAALWGLRGYSGGVIHVMVPCKSTSTKRIRRHLSQLPEDERVIEEGIPVTSVPRTTFDLAATEDVDTVVSLLREAEYRELWDRLSLWDLLERYPGRRGSRTIRSALKRLEEEPSGRKRSKLEERFSPFLRRHHLALPRYNEPIVLPNGKRYIVDCRWPGTKAIVELDGWQGHKGRAAFQEDRSRERRLIAAGYAVMHITWNHLDDEPEEIAADLRALLYKRL